jgi:Cyclic nucleotide-binding domain
LTSATRKRQIVFAQGDPADAVFYIQKGKIELRVLSQQGKEAILAILGADNFLARDAWQVSRCASRRLSRSRSARSCASKNRR